MKRSSLASVRLVPRYSLSYVVLTETFCSRIDRKVLKLHANRDGYVASAHITAWSAAKTLAVELK